VPAAEGDRLEAETPRGQHVGQRPVHHLLHHEVRGRAVHLVDADPVVLPPGDDDAAEPGLRREARAAELPAVPGAVVQGQPRLGQRRGDLDDEGGQRVLLGQDVVPVLGQPVQLPGQVLQPRLLLR